MSVSPILTDMAPAGRDSRSTVTVVNTGTTTLPVEIVVNRLELGENGELGLTPEDADFLIFPPQAMIAPGAMLLTRIFSGATSCARLCISIMMPPLDAA